MNLEINGFNWMFRHQVWANENQFLVLVTIFRQTVIWVQMICLPFLDDY